MENSLYSLNFNDFLVLRINEGDHDVSGAFGHRHSFMVMSQPAWVQQHPALLGVLDGAIISDKTAATTLKI